MLEEKALGKQGLHAVYSLCGLRFGLTAVGPSTRVGWGCGQCSEHSCSECSCLGCPGFLPPQETTFLTVNSIRIGDPYENQLRLM